MKISKLFQERKERKVLLNTHIEFTKIHFICSNECLCEHSIIILSQFKKLPNKRKLYAHIKRTGTHCKKCDQITNIKLENILGCERFYIPKNNKICC